MGSVASAVTHVAENEITEHLGSVEHLFGRWGEEGADTLADFHNIHGPVLSQTKEGLLKQALDRVKNDPAKPKIDVAEINQKAQKAARYAFAGPKDVIIATRAASIEQKYGQAAADSYSNAVAFGLRDYADTRAKFTGLDPMTKKATFISKRVAPYSPLKENVQNAGVDLQNLDPAYHPVGSKERAIKSTMYAGLSPLMAISHIGTAFNGMLGSSPSQFIAATAKTLSQGITAGRDQLQSMVISGAFVESHMKDALEWNQYEATGHAKFTGSSAAYFAHKFFHNPAFSYLRNAQLLLGSNVGLSVARQTAVDFAKNPSSKKLLWNMSELGLDPKKILASGGKLDEEDLGRAVYKFVDQHYFLDNTLQRSQFLQSTWYGRMLGSYHSYVVRQSKLMYRTLAVQIRKEGVEGIPSLMKNLAVMGVLFPLVGEGISVIQKTYRGQAIDPEKDLETVTGRYGAKKALEQWVEMQSHMGAFGVYGHFLRGAQTHQLLNSISGPLFGTAATVGGDVMTAGKNISKHKGRHIKKDLTPLGRDVLFDTPGLNVLGQALAHRVLPTKKDRPKKDPAKVMYHHIRHEDSNGEPLDDEASQ